MAKKNFDDFVNAAGKRKKPSPEEVDELSKLFHAPKSEPVEPAVEWVETPPVLPKKAVEKPKIEPVAARQTAPASKTAVKPASRKLVGKEKIRVTVDLDKSLYQKLKMQVIVEETDLSSYLRELLEANLPK